METLNEIKSPGMESAVSVKPFESWTAIEVAEHVKNIGPAYADSAKLILETGINGKCLSKMLREKDPDLTAKNGLGFTNLMVTNIKVNLGLDS
jgi:hypothetical protein